MKNIKYFFVVGLILLSICSLAQNNKNKAIVQLQKLLTKNNINVKNYQFIKKDDIAPYNKGFTETNSKDSTGLMELKVTADISFYTYEYLPSDYNIFNKEYFIVKEKIYYINDIVDQCKINLKYYNPYFYMKCYWTFENQNKENRIIVIEAYNRTFYMNKEVCSYFVVRMMKNEVKISLLYDKYGIW